MAPRKKQSRNNDANSNTRNGGSSLGKKRKKQALQKVFLFDKDYRNRLQEVLFSKEYIFSKIFRKDGPPLGDHFDPLPPNAFRHCHKTDSKNVHRACQEHQRVFKLRKLWMPAVDEQTCLQTDVSLQKHGIGKGLMTVKSALTSAHSMGKGPMAMEHVSMLGHGIGKGLTTSKSTLMTAHGMGKGLMARKHVSLRGHGIGKGLMTVWQATNPNAGGIPADFQISGSQTKKRKKKQQRQQLIAKKIVNKAHEKRKPFLRSRKVVRQKVEKWKQPWEGKCELALKEGRGQINQDLFAVLVDDEELELQELQAGPKPFSCSAHLTTNGLHGCSLCKDLLAKFPPNSIKMKLPLYKQPWDSSPELVKKLFKAFHFFCTYAVKINLFSFTLEEFAQAFLDKDSLLLGQAHVSLLKLLLSDLEKDLTRDIFPHATKNSKFLGLLQLVENQEFELESWKKSLNPLTWAEILRQVLVAAGYGSKISTSPGKTVLKEVSLMEKYGLRPGTLKGELFSLLLMQGSRGMKVSEMALSAPIVDLDIAPATHELESLISSTLATDITLFEKISSSGYRLRVISSTPESENCGSVSDDFGSVHDVSEASGGQTSDDSECEHWDSSSLNSKRRNQNKSPSNKLTLDTEIDESNPGEAWLLGLMEGEYSDLNIEEKLNALVALIDLVNAGCSIRMEDTVALTKESAPNIYHCSSGGKIKRSTVQPCNSYEKEIFSNKDFSSVLVPRPIDSSVCTSAKNQAENSSITMTILREQDAGCNLHPMQSIFLGSDRRYNRYWLFLGPCDRCDPGHKRIYFESSEDGQWAVIDTEEAFSMLLSSLDNRGAREAFLLASFETRESFLFQAMSSSPDESRIRQSSQSDLSDLIIPREESPSAVSDVENLGLMDMQMEPPFSGGSISFDFLKRTEQQEDAWGRIQAFNSWVWKSFYSDLNAVKNGKRSYLDSFTRCLSCHDLYWRDEKHCKMCHATFELDFDLEEKYAIHIATCQANTGCDKLTRHKVNSLQLQTLKAATYAIESVMPDDAVGVSWKKSAHNFWVKRLRRASTLADFLQVVGDFVSTISKDWLYRFHDAAASNSILKEVLANFPGIPQTSSAIALWLVQLDMVVAPYLKEDCSPEKLLSSGLSKGKPPAKR